MMCLLKLNLATQRPFFRRIIFISTSVGMSIMTISRTLRLQNGRQFSINGRSIASMESGQILHFATFGKTDLAVSCSGQNNFTERILSMAKTSKQTELKYLARRILAKNELFACNILTIATISNPLMAQQFTMLTNKLASLKSQHSTKLGGTIGYLAQQCGTHFTTITQLPRRILRPPQ